MAFKALIEMDFWQKNVVSEDAGIFWKAFLFYDGDYQIVPLHYFVSMDSCVGKNPWQTVVNLYRQQRRWAWGSEGIPYLLFGFLKNKKIVLKKKINYSFLMIRTVHSSDNFFGLVVAISFCHKYDFSITSV